MCALCVFSAPANRQHKQHTSLSLLEFQWERRESTTSQTIQSNLFCVFLLIWLMHDKRILKGYPCLNWLKNNHAALCAALRDPKILQLGVKCNSYKKHQKPRLFTWSLFDGKFNQHTNTPNKCKYTGKHLSDVANEPSNSSTHTSRNRIFFLLETQEFACVWRASALLFTGSDFCPSTPGNTWSSWSAQCTETLFKCIEPRSTPTDNWNCIEIAINCLSVSSHYRSPHTCAKTCSNFWLNLCHGLPSCSCRLLLGIWTIEWPIARCPDSSHAQTLPKKRDRNSIHEHLKHMQTE